MFAILTIHTDTIRRSHSQDGSWQDQRDSGAYLISHVFSIGLVMVSHACFFNQTRLSGPLAWSDDTI